MIRCVRQSGNVGIGTTSIDQLAVGHQHTLHQKIETTNSGSVAALNSTALATLTLETSTCWWRGMVTSAVRTLHIYNNNSM